MVWPWVVTSRVLYFQLPGHWATRVKRCLKKLNHGCIFSWKSPPFPIENTQEVMYVCAERKNDFRVAFTKWGKNWIKRTKKYEKICLLMSYFSFSPKSWNLYTPENITHLNSNIYEREKMLRINCFFNQIINLTEVLYL